MNEKFTPGKWQADPETGRIYDDNDKITASQLREIFTEAYVLALKRFHGVLGDQINAIDASEHQEEQS